MKKSFYEQKCRICGCDWNHACNDHDYWFTDDLCSACAEKMKPIFFNTPMVQAILQNRKTTTRRPVKNLAISDNGDGYFTAKEIHKGEITEHLDETFGGPYDFVAGNAVQYARYQKGDILYVRETWQKFGRCFIFKADEEKLTWWKNLNIGKWHPSIHMPKEAARIFLRVIDVRAQRIRDITEDGAKAEGLISTAKSTPDGLDYTGLTAYDQFGDLWDSTVKKSDLDKYGWAVNPWIWVYEFKRIGAKVA